MFEKATRMKLRFPFKGMVSVEDLWDISLTGLDSIYKVLSVQLKNSHEESLLGKKTKETEELDLQIEIVKHIVTVKLAEAENRRLLVEKKEKKEKILAILADKQDESLKQKTPEELEKMLEEL